MKYDPYKHHRRSIRLRGYDYSKPGVYFITLCVNKRLCLFGEIIEGKMILNDTGDMVNKIWQDIPEVYYGIEINKHVLMPNHFHGIIIIKNDTVGASLSGRPMTNKNPSSSERSISNNIKRISERKYEGQAQGPAPTVEPIPLGDIVGRFESFTTYKYMEVVKNHHWESFYKKLWQRNYYERIIRNEKELNAIRQYIINNPINWQGDNDNPLNWKKEK